MFENVLSEIIALIISFITGGAIGGFLIHLKYTKTTMTQKSKKNSVQYQIGTYNEKD